MLLLPVNQTSIFSWREGRPSSNVNKAWEREAGKDSTSTLMFESVARHCSQDDSQEETRKGLIGFKDKKSDREVFVGAFLRGSMGAIFGF